MEVEELTCPPTAAINELLTLTIVITPRWNVGPAFSWHFGRLKTIVGVDNDFVNIYN